MISMPWRNLTDEWNAALNGYYSRRGRHLHGTLPGSRGKDFPHGRDCKECVVLVVMDHYQGKPINLRQWHGVPDYRDLTRIIAVPLDMVLRGVKRGREVMAEDSLRLHAQWIVDLHNASLDSHPEIAEQAHQSLRNQRRSDRGGL